MGKRVGGEIMADEKTQKEAVSVPAAVTSSSTATPVSEKPKTPVSEKPKRQEPKFDVQVTPAKLVIDIPIECEDVAEIPDLRNEVAKAEALTKTLVGKAHQAIRAQKSGAAVARLTLDLVEKKVVQTITFEPPLNAEGVAEVKKALK